MRQKRHAAPGRLLGILLTGLAAQPARAEYGMNLVRGATDLSHRVFDLHMISLWVCAAIGVVVFGAMFYSLFAFRKSRGAVAANFHENTTVEVVWTTIPFIILIAMAIPATKTLIALEDTSDSGLTIKVTGYQWRWQYEYLGEDVSFFSNLAQSSRDAMNGDPTGVEHYLLDVGCRSTPRCGSSSPRTMSSTRGGCRRWAGSRTLSQDSSMTAGPAFRSRASTVDNVPSCAARITASCR